MDAACWALGAAEVAREVSRSTRGAAEGACRLEAPPVGAEGGGILQAETRQASAAEVLGGAPSAQPEEEDEPAGDAQGAGLDGQNVEAARMWLAQRQQLLHLDNEVLDLRCR